MLKLVEAATVKPVTLEELKAHCRVDFADDDNSLSIYLDAAIEFVADCISQVLSPSVYRADLSRFWSGCFSVLASPVREITSVSYLDVNGSRVTVDPSLYRWKRTAEGAEITLLSAFIEPPVQSERDDAVQIEVSAGYDDPAASGAGDDPDLMLPERAKQAILLLASAWYANREAVSQVDLKPIPFAIDALLAQLRIYR